MVVRYNLLVGAHGQGMAREYFLCLRMMWPPRCHNESFAQVSSTHCLIFTTLSNALPRIKSRQTAASPQLQNYVPLIAYNTCYPCAECLH